MKVAGAYVKAWVWIPIDQVVDDLGAGPVDEDDGTITIEDEPDDSKQKPDAIALRRQFLATAQGRHHRAGELEIDGIGEDDDFALPDVVHLSEG